MKKLLYTIILLCIINIIYSQNEKVSGYIPNGYTILDSISGDLNKDGFKDLIVILKNDLETINPDTTRPLLILHGTKTRGYNLVTQNEHIVLCANCGGIFGDPYDTLVLKNNYFSVEHYGGSNWRWSRIITFKFDLKTKQYVLHKDAGVSFHTSDPDKITNIVTRKKDFGKLPFVKYNCNLD